MQRAGRQQRRQQQQQPNIFLERIHLMQNVRRRSAMPHLSPLLSPFARAAVALVIAASICAALPGDLLAASDFVSEEPPFFQDWTVTYAPTFPHCIIVTLWSGTGFQDSLTKLPPPPPLATW